MPLADKIEKQWDNDLFGAKGVATMFGWQSQWTFRSKGSRAGFPDRTCWRDRVLFVELKREASTATPLTAAQRATLDGLARAGAECYLWRPSDFDEAGRVLGRHWRYNAYNRSLQVDGKGWTPASLWVAGVGRWDGQCVCGEINTRHCPVHGQGGDSQEAA